MSVSHEAAARGKTSRHLRFKAPNPGASRVHPVESSSAARSVYDGRERLAEAIRTKTDWSSVLRQRIRVLAWVRAGRPPLSKWHADMMSEDRP